MGKQKQQIISRFFAPKPQTPSSSSSQSLPQPPSLPNPSTPPPKISATVTFSPSKRFRTSQLISPNKKPTKTPKFSSVAGDSEPSLPNTAVSEPPPGKPTKTCKFSPHTHNPIPPPPNPSLHQRFIQKLLEPSEDLLEPCSSTFKVSSSNPKYTPLEQQVVELKAKYPDVLLMVEVGYKYRFFGKDAENAARALGIYAHMDHNFLTASIPTVRLNVHVRRLVNAGYKVGVVKQTETAAIKAHGSNRLGPFCRGLSALYTKATLEAAEDLGGGEEGFVACNNYLVCVVENDESRIEGELDVRIGVVGVEVSTGDVVYGEFNDNFMRAGLEAMVLSLSPAELLLGEPLSKQTEKFLLAYAGPTSNVRVGRTSCHCFRDGGALVEVVSLYDNMNEDNSTDHGEEDAKAKDQRNTRVAIEGIMAMPDLAVQALALTIRHLKEFGFERILCLGASFRPFLSNVEMALSANAIQQLEVLKNNSDGSESGSLLQCMNHTLTIFGSRLLRHWVTHPLCDRNMISARLDAVSEIVMSMNTCNGSRNFDSDGEQSGVTIVQPEVYHLISSVLTTLGRSPDIQRGITRIFHRTATPSEFIAVIQVIVAAGKQLQQLHIEEDEMHTRTVNSVLLRKLISTASSSSLISAAAKLMSTLNKEAADQRELHNLFITSDGRFPEVAEARSRVKSAKDKLALLIELFRKQLGMRKLDYVCVSGVTHLIKLPVDMRVPPSWVRVNSTKKMIRYHPPEVLTALDQLSLANEELTVVCRAAWNSFLKSFGAYYAEFQTAVQALATLDCLYSLAILSRNKNYVRPIFVNDNEPVQIEICSGRHPVMETILQDNFVPNDTCLHADSEYCQIITGPNMGGKSCYIRQVALIAIMAQVGSFVPASSAKLHVLDGIYTRMGASDNIHQGRSTFLEELTETSQILQNCTENSLVIIDELGRGTSTHDGVAIAYSTLHYLLQQKKCVVLFVTHYPKLIDIKGEFSDSVGTYHVSYLTSETNMDLDLDSGRVVKSVHCEDVTYLYKLVPGVSERSFGFKVAQLAQLPSSCVRRAIVMSRRFEMAVADKKKNVLELICSKEPPFLNQEEHEEELESLKELTNAYRNFFSALDNAFSGDNGVEKTFQFLHQARGVAMEVLNGL